MSWNQVHNDDGTLPDVFSNGPAVDITVGAESRAREDAVKAFVEALPIEERIKFERN